MMLNVFNVWAEGVSRYDGRGRYIAKRAEAMREAQQTSEAHPDVLVSVYRYQYDIKGRGTEAICVVLNAHPNQSTGEKLYEFKAGRRLRRRRKH